MFWINCNSLKIVVNKFSKKYSSIICFSFLLLIISAGFGADLYAQQNPNKKSFNTKLTYKDTLVDMNERFIIQFSELVYLNYNTILKPADDYRIDYKTGKIHLDPFIYTRYSLDTFQIYNLKIEYDVFPYNFKREYSNFEIITEKDSVTGDTVEIATKRTDLMESLFEGTSLEKSGSLFRGLTIGSNRDLTLNSGFRLQLNGKLTNDIEIVAALTDENTPIQPEGNTQKLQELDKVFIEVKNKKTIATIGDINVNFENTNFANFSRKIQGAKGYTAFDFGDIQLTGAVARGKFNTNVFTGKDGVQGPYRLIGKDNETTLLVLSGTEKVYLNGVQMVRGDQADYTIDYGIGEITFTNKRLITSNSRITVDFEYSDRKYSRMLIAGKNGLKFGNDKFGVGITFINESDNPDKTIDFTLSDADKILLQNAGDDKFKAIRSGVTFVGLDSLGRSKGVYVLVDTIVGGVQDTVYRYDPGNVNAQYQVGFTYVGPGKGDYTKETIFKYNFVGIKQGDYQPIVFIPIPTSYQLGDISLNYSSSPKNEFYLNLEGAFSSLNKNKVSITDVTQKGTAINGLIGFKKEKFNLAGLNLKSVELNFRERVINRAFNTLERLNTIEFDRTYDIQDSTNLTEELREGNLKFSPNKYMNLSGLYGMLKRGNDFTALRTNAGVFLKDDSLKLPTLNYVVDIVNSENFVTGSKSKWVKQAGELNYFKLFNVQSSNPSRIYTSFFFNNENRKNNFNLPTRDSLDPGSFTFTEYRPIIAFENIFNFDISGEYNFRTDQLSDNGVIKDLSNTYTQLYGLKYNGLSWFRPEINLTIRDKKYSPDFLAKGNSDNQTVLVNSIVRLDPFNSAVQTDLLYNVSSERSAKLEKLFVLVPIGQGNYIYLGDLNSNGIQDENEFTLTNNNDGTYVRINLPTDKLFPIIDVNTSARVILRPSRYLNIKSGSIIGDLVNNFTSESYYRIDEKSKDPVSSDLYFLRTGAFLSDSNTIIGTQVFQQDLNFFEYNPGYSLKLRFLQQKGLTQYSSGNERSLSIQRSGKLKIGVAKDITTQLEYVNKIDRNIAPVISVRNRNIDGDAFNTDLSYRPVQQIESGLQLNFIRATDTYPTTPNLANINQQILRFIYSFAQLGRLRLEIERDEVRLTNSSINIPYELTNGRVSGKSYFWRGIFDYNLSKNIQASVNYDGRIEGGRNAIHTGRAEVRAFF